MPPLKLKDLEEITGGQPLGITEDECRDIQHAADEVVGKQGSYSYPGQYGCLYALYDAIAEIVVHAQTDPAVLELTIPRLVEYVRSRNWRHISPQECRSALTSRITAWQAKHGKMVDLKKRFDVQAEHDRQIDEFTKRNEEAEIEREAQKRFAIEQRVEELRLKDRSVVLTNDDALRLLAAQAKVRDELPVSKEPSLIAESTGPCKRKIQIEEFLAACNTVNPTRIYKRHIWLCVGHKKGKQFERWQACSVKATAADNRNFSRVLDTEPAAFVALLKQKRIIS